MPGDVVAQHSDAFDFHFDHVARSHPLRIAGRPGVDQISWREGNEAADEASKYMGLSPAQKAILYQFLGSL